MAKVHIRKVVDASGSMLGRESSVVDGSNEFDAKLQGTDTEDEVLVSLGFFDRHGADPTVRWVYDGVPLSEVGEISRDQYVPRGTTPLNDAVADATHLVLDAMEEGDRGLVVVTTDGHENASTEYTTERLRDLVQKAESQGVEFIYLGANVDSFDESRSRGITTSASWSGTARGAHNASLRSATLASSYVADRGSYGAVRGLAATMGSIPDDDDQFLAQERALAEAAATVSGGDS